MATKKFCDRCGEEVSALFKIYTLYEQVPEGFNPELCEPCFSYIRNYVEHPNLPTPTPEGGEDE